MTTLRQKSKNKKKVSVWIAVAVFALIVLLRFVAPTFLGNITFFVTTPFMKSQSFFGGIGASITDSFSSKIALQKENDDLKNKLAEAQVAIDRDKLLVQENTDLKDLLGRHSKSSSILATVIAKPPFSLYDTVVVDVGSSDKVSVGDVVLALGTVPIGTIHAVYARTSTVQLYSSSGQQIDVRIGKNTQTTAEAEGGGNFLIKLPKGTVLAEGDPIAAPGIGVDVFGHVESIETNDNDPFIYVRFSLPVNMSELHFVQIDRSATL